MVPPSFVYQSLSFESANDRVMARQEADKEDLIQDATAMVDRAEFFLNDAEWKVITVGYRRNGFLSVYFDQDPFYQFDADGKLRRALKELLLYRSQNHRLVMLQRQRSAQQTVLQHTLLSPPEQQHFLTTMRQQLLHFATCLRAGNFRPGRRVTADSTFDQRLLTSLQMVVDLSDDQAIAGSIAAR